MFSFYTALMTSVSFTIAAIVGFDWMFALMELSLESDCDFISLLHIFIIIWVNWLNAFSDWLL